MRTDNALSRTVGSLANNFNDYLCSGRGTQRAASAWPFLPSLVATTSQPTTQPTTTKTTINSLLLNRTQNRNAQGMSYNGEASEKGLRVRDDIACGTNNMIYKAHTSST